LGQYAVPVTTKLPRQQKSFGKNPEKQQAREVAWGIGNGKALLSALKKQLNPTAGSSVPWLLHNGAIRDYELILCFMLT